MFSGRISSHPKNRLTLLLEEKQRWGGPLIDLTESNPTRVGLVYPGEEILSALSDPGSLRYEPHPFGLEKTREAIAAYYAGHGQKISLQDVMLTASTSEAYSYLFKILADPGTHFLIPQPSYPLFDFLAAGECVEGISYPLFYQEGWELHAASIENLIGPATRGLILLNPNNPTGSFVKTQEWKDVQQICAGSGLPVICDEVFFDYRLDTQVIPCPLRAEEHVLTFILSGLSKLLGLPQMKLSWVVISGPEELKRQARERLEITADTFLSVGTPVQLAAPKLLDLREGIQKQILQRLGSNLRSLKEMVVGSAVEGLPVEGGWYAVLRFPGTRSDEEWALFLLSQENVVVHPGYFFDFSEEAFLVISLLPEPAVFQEGVRRLIRAAS